MKEVTTVAPEKPLWSFDWGFRLQLTSGKGLDSSRVSATLYGIEQKGINHEPTQSSCTRGVH